MPQEKGERFVAIINRNKVNELPLVEFLHSEYEDHGVHYSQTIKKALAYYREFKLGQITPIHSSEKHSNSESGFNMTSPVSIVKEPAKDSLLMKGFNGITNKDFR